MKFHDVSLVLVLTTGAFLSGCNGLDPSTLANTSAQSTVTTPPPTSITVLPATSSECASGGITVKSFTDTNKNGTWDTGELVLSSNTVCNGAQGIGAGITAQPAVGASCTAGGIVVTTYVDTNNNGALDSGEPTTSSSTICNGTNGTNGANGSNGTNGTNGAAAHLTVTTATSAQCANGGSVYKSWTEGVTPTSTIVCNGTNGQNGQNGQDGLNASFSEGHVGDMITGKAYSACHHDYLYVGGWLVLRHQVNGTADQGVGTTGFNVWNVDITDFLLVSEVGNVTYCTLHWDATQKRLTYTVNDGTDGQAGVTGTIVMQ